MQGQIKYILLFLHSKWYNHLFLSLDWFSFYLKMNQNIICFLKTSSICEITHNFHTLACSDQSFYCTWSKITKRYRERIGLVL